MRKFNLIFALFLSSLWIFDLYAVSGIRPQYIVDPDHFYKIPEKLLRADRPGYCDLVMRFIRQQRVLHEQRIRFRGEDKEFVERAYSEMSDEEFAAVNGRQNWMEERQVGRELDRHVPRDEALILDLGMGPASSTKIIARYAPPTSVREPQSAGWRIIGYDFSGPLVEKAKRIAAEGLIRNVAGEIIPTEFVQQSIVGTLKNSDETPVEVSSVDFINTSGVVGHHLSAADVDILAKEMMRVLKGNRYVAIDTAGNMGPRDVRPIFERNGFKFVKYIQGNLIGARPKLVFYKEPELFPGASVLY